MEIAVIIIGVLLAALLAAIGFAVRRLINTVGQLAISVAKIVQWIECKDTECRDHWKATHDVEKDVDHLKERVLSNCK